MGVPKSLKDNAMNSFRKPSLLCYS